MIDYASMGFKIKEARLKKGVTQEQLAEAVGVGVTHISHLETGSGTVSLKVFLAIVNYLECSADEILCKEIGTARPIVDSWLAELVADCDQTEVKIIADTVAALKNTLRKNKPTE
ncbi:MAG: helix-turn-helix transcriptional regulator [Oscillospiraceae bacterium]|nr:helix-turn-helix transcriptional regulator [Oscillospiraceae bacterium]